MLVFWVWGGQAELGTWDVYVVWKLGVSRRRPGLFLSKKGSRNGSVQGRWRQKEYAFLFRRYGLTLRLWGQIGFLSEWQLYAQKIEGDSWVGEKLDPGKIEKMSGKAPQTIPP